MKNIIIILLSNLIASFVFAQSDSVSVFKKDTIVKKSKPKTVIILPKTRANSLINNKITVQSDLGADSIKFSTPATITPKVANAKGLDSIYRQLVYNPFFTSRKKPFFLVTDEKQHQSKDEIFYILIIILSLLAFVKLTFSKYFNYIFHQLVQPSFKQNQTREQLSQNNLPSLLLNMFFVLSGGAFIALLLQYYDLSTENFSKNLLYASGILLLLNAGKYLFLSFTGWVFQSVEATEIYLSIIFLVNRILGIVLLPFVFIIAFANQAIINIAVTISLMLVIILFVYRYFAAFSPIKKDIKISYFHFIIYILAFEIVPFLVIYKSLSNYLMKSS